MLKKITKKDAALKAKKSSQKPWYLYVIRTDDNLLYTGITTNLARRFSEHSTQCKKSAKFLKVHKAYEMVFSQKIGKQGLALKVEYYFKRLTKKKKEEYVKNQRIDIVKLIPAKKLGNPS